jgi:hypothetical protein
MLTAEGRIAGAESMSTPDNNSLPPELEDAHACWMDDDAAGDAASSPAENVRALGDEVPMKAAQRQLVHALLQQLGKREIDARRDRLDRVLDQLKNLSAEKPNALPPRAARRRKWLLRAAVAACVALVVALPFYALQSNSALAALESVTRAIDAAGDRTYRISVEPTDSTAKQDVRMSGRDQPLEERRPGLDGSVLYVRGARQFVLCRQAPNGKRVFNGSNGQQHWLVRPDRPVLVSSDPSAFRIPMPENMASIALGEVRSSLASLRTGYALIELPPERLGDRSPELWRCLRASKLDPSTKGPKTVSIWFDPKTYVIGRIEFDQIHFQGRPEPRRLTMLLISSGTLSPDWFDHNAHHAPAAPMEEATR